jgi:flagellar hook-associated protein 2
MGLRLGAVTFGGLSSGIDTNDIISQLVELQRRPVTLLENQKADFEEKLSILRDLSTRVRTLQTQLRGLDNMDNSVGAVPSVDEEFKKTTSTTTATSSHPELASVTATGSAQSATIKIEVEQLAQNDRHVSDGFSSDTTSSITNGTFSVTVNGVTTTIEIDGTNDIIVNGVDTGIDTSEANDSLAGFVEAINASGANLRGYVVDTNLGGSPYRLFIEGDTGEDEQITFDDDRNLNFTEQQDAQNARIALDPGGDEIDIEGATNVFTDIIQGVSIEALEAGGTDITINVTTETVTNADSIVTSIEEFVSAYNDVISLIQDQAQVDPETNRGGPLIGDTTLLGLQRQLSSIVVSVVGEGNVVAASQIGLSTGTDGQLSLDETKLREQLSESLDDVAAFFAGEDSFADQLRTVADTYLRPVTGLLVTRIDGTSASISDLEDQIERAEDRLETFEENLVRQFAALESAISGFQQQSSFITQYLLTLNG